MKKLLFIIMLSIGYSTFAYSQLTTEHNSIRQGDELIKYQVEYIDPGKKGINILWDFSNLKTINEEYTVTYSDAPLLGDSLFIMGYDSIPKEKIKTENLLVATEHGTMYYYLQRNDSLLLLGHENPVVKLQYKDPYLMAVYPISFGNTVYSSYTTQGKYSGTEPINTKGIVETVADAFGSMILPSGDTISPILRVKTSQTIIDQIINENIETATNQKVLETFRWYTKGYRYPIFETVRNINLVDSTMLFGTCFFFPPQDHYYLNTDSDNQALLDKLWDIDQEPTPEGDPTAKTATIEDYIVCQLYPNPVESILNLKYELKQDAKVSFELYSIEGLPIKKIKTRSKNAGIYYETIDCSNLQPKSYVLRITANNLLVNEIIIKE